MNAMKVIQKLESHYGKKMPEEKMAEYLKSLKSFSESQLANVADLAIKTFKWMPSLSELLELLGVSRENLARLAFDVLTNTLDCGLDCDDAVWFSDPTLQAAIRTCGGWGLVARKYRNNQENFFTWFVKQFIEEYDRHYLSGGNTLVCRDFQPIGNMVRPMNKKRIVCTWSPEYQVQTRVTHAPSGGSNPVLIGSVLSENQQKRIS